MPQQVRVPSEADTANMAAEPETTPAPEDALARFAELLAQKATTPEQIAEKKNNLYRVVDECIENEQKGDDQVLQLRGMNDFSRQLTPRHCTIRTFRLSHHGKLRDRPLVSTTTS